MTYITEQIQKNILEYCNPNLLSTDTDVKPKKIIRLKNVFIVLSSTNSYIPIPHSLLEYIITNTKLSYADKAVFFHIHAISFFNYHKNKERTIASSLLNISKKLHVSKAQIFASQKKLEQFGLFLIKRQKNRSNQSKPNRPH